MYTHPYCVTCLQVKPSQLFQHPVLHVKDTVQNNQRDIMDEIRKENMKLQRRLVELQKQNTLIESCEHSSIAVLDEQIKRHSEQILNLTDNVSRIGDIPAAKHSSDLDNFEDNQCTKALTQVNGMVNEVGLKVDILSVRSINGIQIMESE